MYRWQFCTWKKELGPKVKQVSATCPPNVRQMSVNLERHPGTRVVRTCPYLSTKCPPTDISRTTGGHLADMSRTLGGQMLRFWTSMFFVVTSGAASGRAKITTRVLRHHSQGLVQGFTNSFDYMISSFNGLNQTHSLALIMMQRGESERWRNGKHHPKVEDESRYFSFFAFLFT